MQFSPGKHQALSLGRQSPEELSRLGTAYYDSRCPGKFLGLQGQRAAQKPTEANLGLAAVRTLAVGAQPGDGALRESTVTLHMLDHTYILQPLVCAPQSRRYIVKLVQA